MVFVFGVILGGLCLGLFSRELSDGLCFGLFSMVCVSDYFRWSCLMICVWDYFRWFVFRIIFGGLCLGLFLMVSVWDYFRWFVFGIISMVCFGIISDGLCLGLFSMPGEGTFLTIFGKVTILVLLKCQLCFLGTPPFALVFPIMNLIITGYLSLAIIDFSYYRLFKLSNYNFL